MSKTILSLLFISFFSCTSSNETKSGEKNKSNIKVTLNLETIENYSDSTLNIYKKSIQYLKKHTNDSSYLIKVYQDSILHFYKHINVAIEEVSNLYMNEGLSQRDYNFFEKQLTLKLTEVQREVQKLKKLGFKYSLK